MMTCLEQDNTNLVVSIVPSERRHSQTACLVKAIEDNDEDDEEAEEKETRQDNDVDVRKQFSRGKRKWKADTRELSISSILVRHPRRLPGSFNSKLSMLLLSGLLLLLVLVIGTVEANEQQQQQQQHRRWPNITTAHHHEQQHVPHHQHQQHHHHHHAHHRHQHRRHSTSSNRELAETLLVAASSSSSSSMLMSSIDRSNAEMLNLTTTSQVPSAANLATNVVASEHHPNEPKEEAANSTLPCDQIFATNGPKANTNESIELCGCLSNEFLCNQTCIDKTLIVCDTKVDCLGETDEQNCETYVCPSTHFKCNNHYCIFFENVCDFKNDCGDNSDEFSCTHRDCWFGEHKCDNGQCIQTWALCNGIQDCVDGSDEKQCNNVTDFINCDDDVSVHRSLWCDGKPDCHRSHQDELNCRECNASEFRCENSRCIPLGNLCDTVCDCTGSCEDEKQNCEDYYTQVDGVKYCSRANTVACSLHESGLSVERCLGREHICNGFADCPGIFDDESGCGYTEEDCLRLENHFWCPVERRCLPASVRCNYIQECLGAFDELDCPEHERECPQLDPAKPFFKCANGQCIEAHHRCDSPHFDCFDKSDEVNCSDHRCPPGYTKCASGQCINATYWCDWFENCFDKSDEANCARDQMDDQRRRPNAACDPATQFTCDNGQCIAREYRCVLGANPREQCADGSNLRSCSQWNCTSESRDLIKCAGSYCVVPELKCNGKLDCPRLSDWADEASCYFNCSRNTQCPCFDTTINCTNQQLTQIPEGIEDQILRMILKNNKLGHNLTSNMFNKCSKCSSMQMLDLSLNEINHIPPGLFRNFWMLRILDLKENNIELIDSNTFHGAPNLATLTLNGNQIRSIHEYAFNGLASLNALDLSNQRLVSVHKNAFYGLRSLKTLDLSGNLIQEIDDGAFNGLPNLISIDLSHNELIRIGPKAFHGLNSLKQITFDEFRFCCLVRHIETCHPPASDFSSCEDLMSNTILRICIWVLGTIALFANLFVILWRLKYQTVNRVHSFLIINLALGDLLMGVYLLIIASVDQFFRGIYFIVDASWRSSSLCHLAGFLSTLSSEFSVFALLVITIDRLITITFPFRIYRMRMKDARVIIITLWLVAIIFSGLPLTQFEYFGNFYGRSGVCLALHITNERPPGWEYSVFIFLVLNLISFTLICGSYLWMFIAARNTQIAARSKENATQNRMARRMMFIVLTDFFCWWPVITLGIVSLFDVEVPRDVFAWIAVFVLPLNAAVNPTLYTLSGLTNTLRSKMGKGKSSRQSMTMNQHPRPTSLKHVHQQQQQHQQPHNGSHYNNNHLRHNRLPEKGDNGDGGGGGGGGGDDHTTSYL